MPSVLLNDIAANCIRVRGAHTHNLRNIDVDIPRGELVVVTGVSGSGKSSLAFDTLFAEGQRRYLETLSAQTRAYLDQMQRPDVDEIEGMPPVLSIEQRVAAVQPRSTLATTTGIHDFLRLLYARAGKAHCPNCGRELSQQSTQAVVGGILALEAGRKAMILAPLVRGKKGMHRELFEKIAREGFVRARVDGAIVDASAAPALKKSKTHDIDVIVDRVVVKEGLRARLFESVELALRRGNGTCIVSHEEGGQWRDRIFSSRFACPDCELSFPEIEPRTFSANSPYGACPACQGLGVIRRDGEPSLDGGVCPDCQGARLAPIGRAVTFAGIPIHELLALTVAEAEQAIGQLLTAIADSRAVPPFVRGSQGGSDGGSAVGARGARPDDILAEQAALIESQSAIDGPPLPPSYEGGEPRGQTRIATSEIQNPKSEINVRATNRGADAAPLTGPALLVAERLLPEIHRRLEYLRKVGLDYLSLDRPTQSLSGGEFQRARIAGCLGAGLIGVCYILDEPTVGLHPRDTRRLLETLRELRDQGNSLVVVEHDLDVMREADRLIDLGPGAGREGGRVVACGTPAEVMDVADSLTGRYLRQATSPLPARRAGDDAGRGGDKETGRQGEYSAAEPQASFSLSGLLRVSLSSPPAGRFHLRRSVDLSRALMIDGASAHNLTNLSVSFPLGVLTCVTGVSGSGKSTLVMETLVPRVRAALASRLPVAGQGDQSHTLPPLPPGEGRGEGRAESATRPFSDTLPEDEGTAARPTAGAGLRGIEQIDRLVEIDQSPLGRSARSNPATASGMWDEIRRIFARTRAARLRGFRSSRFSFNAAGGRCEECRGQGVRRLAMQFLPDIDVVCPVCQGARFNRQTLQVRFRGKSVADILEMRIDEAAAFFANFADLSATLATFQDVGLGYLTLGQSAATLSGGEAQRIKLASELSRHQSSHTTESSLRAARSSTDPPFPPLAKGGNTAAGKADPKSEIPIPKSEIQRTLYVLDEPTTGLHPADVARLLDLLDRLVASGHTVIVIEHQLDVIARSDWVIDLGPEGGAGGGRVVAAGTPDEIACVPASHTGRALRRHGAGF
jgi:excinuclease ABC subunit A